MLGKIALYPGQSSYIDEWPLLKSIEELKIGGYLRGDISEYIDPTSEKYAKMVEWIRKDIDVSTLRFQLLDDMIKAVGIPKEKLCTYCWTGECPGCSSQASETKEGNKNAAKVA